jgi:hypothetical protein
MMLRRVAFATGAVTLAAVLAVAGLFGADVYLHKRTERSAGLNMWGYRGPVAPRKRPGEIRVAVLGGSTVFGYGLTWDRAFPVQLEERLNVGSQGQRRFSVVNLGYNNEGAYSFRYTLEDYAYLDIDIVCLYEGYNDLMGDGNGGNPSIYRHKSPLFRATGYLPILPLVFREKAMALRYGGNLGAAYAAQGRTVFQPTLATRATSGALNAAASIGDSLEHQIARFGSDTEPSVVQTTGNGCAFPWGGYCQAVGTAIDYALGQGRRVLFVTQPYLTGERGRDRHIWQQHAVEAMLHERYASRRDFQYVNLGEAIDLRDAGLTFDGMHLTPAGNGRVADLLAAPVLTAAASGG